MNELKPHSRVKPVMIYLNDQDRADLNAYAKKEKLPVSQLAREGIRMRITESDYNTGFNDGLNEAQKVTQSIEGAKMMFPSGKSFADLVCENIQQLARHDGTKG
jgi:hypothetical protein